jgi:hypothetical protein
MWMRGMLLEGAAAMMSVDVVEAVDVESPIPSMTTQIMAS